jgi:beta-aspartyl-peptidase (threonine type)
MIEATGWTLLVHGGAGILERETIAPDAERGIRAGLTRALDAGSTVLAAGGTALDAVEAAVRTLEDDPHFNAGRGAVFTYEGDIRLDAAIMDGSSRDAGAVTGIHATRNPVSLARAVMEKSPHVLLSGVGADQFSLEQDLEQVDTGYFETDERRRQLEVMKANKADWFDVDMKYGTVGAVARDAHGHVAAATSTGGITGKRWGRIGDSPVIGAGTYADDRTCAVSATGSGEFFIREAVGHEIGARIRLSGDVVATAADAVMAEVQALGGTGGVVVVGADGAAASSFTTPGMNRGYADASGARRVAIFGDESLDER